MAAGSPTIETRPALRKGTISFIIITAFLNLMGVGILIPVLPNIVGRYVSSPTDQLWIVSLMFTSYSLCQFIATPSLGALSDRYGRRPILLISLFGSAVGYLMLGIGGAVWVLFAGRIIDGITGGNISTIYAYAADISTREERTRYYSMVGASAGMGFVIGPAMGGVLYKITGSTEAPMIAAALLTMLNVIWGYFVMPESLTAEKRDNTVSWGRANPLSQLTSVFRIPQIRLLLIAILLWTIALSVVQSNIAYLTENQLGWTPDQTSLLFFVIGTMQIVTQWYFVGWLVPRFGEGRVALAGMVSLTFGLSLIAITGLVGFAPLVFAAAFFNSLGNGLIIPTTAALLSQSVSMREQGRIQGGNQSVQALARVLGPLYGGFTYAHFNSSVTYFGAAAIVVVCFLIARISVNVIAQHKANAASAEPMPTLTQTTRVVTQSSTISH